MSIGKDGFTDCTYVCNPENYMAWSCAEYCPDYVFTSKTSMTVSTSKPNSSDTKFNGSENNLSYVVVISCAAILVFAILFIIYCLNKQRMATYFGQICSGKDSQHSGHAITSDSDVEAMPGRSAAGEDRTALLSLENETKSKSNDKLISNQGNSKRSVNLANSFDSDRRSNADRVLPSVHALTHAVKPNENRLQIFPNDETDLKEVGERADIAIGQSSSFAFKITPIEGFGSISIGNSNKTASNSVLNSADDTIRKTDANVDDSNVIPNETGGHIANGFDQYSNVERADDEFDEYVITCNPDHEDVDEDVDDDAYDDDNEEEGEEDEEKENRNRKVEEDILLNDNNVAKFTTNKTHSTLSSTNVDILHATTETNIREM